MQVSGRRFQQVANVLILFTALQAFADEKVDTLVQSEIAFARTASEKGTKSAFLANLADDSVLFRPGAVPGKKWTAEHPETPGVLIWEPSYAEISGAGDLGFTTGPYTYKQSKEAYYGQFFSIWKKQSDHSWKVFLDTGIEFDHEKEKSALKTRTGKASTVSAEEKEKQQQIVRSADLAPASFAKDALLLHTQDSYKNCKFAQEGSGISESADLAYVYGTYQCDASNGIYVRMWRKEESWKVALDYRK